MNNIVISGINPNEVWRRCKEKKAQGYIEVEPLHKTYSTTQRYHYDGDSIPKYSRRIFAGVDEIVKYRAVYRRG